MKYLESQILYQSIYLLLVVFFCVLGSEALINQSVLQEFTLLSSQSFVVSDTFRDHTLNEEFLVELDGVSTGVLGETIGSYFLQIEFGDGITGYQWEDSSEWSIYLEACNAIWNDIEFFPVPDSTSNMNATVSYVDTWGDSRTYGGERLHEGTDIIANIDTPGLYPIISVTDGIVTNLGWLEQGGYRVGITSESGGYFYYAHLDSYSGIQEGDTVQAGQILGYMGDSGYGEEGTTGMFPVHLHFGIYINVNGEEISVNPYWVLRFLEENKLKFNF